MRVAIVSYYTPPQFAIASHRVLRLTRVLLTVGHEVHWVTADAARIDAAQLDPSLGALAPDAVVVHGIDGQALITKPVAANWREKVLRTLAWHAPRKFAWPDSFLSWSRRLQRRLPALVRDHSIDAVVLCCSPHNQILVLPRLRRACADLLICVDYRDLLSGNPWNTRQSSAITNRLVELERRVLACADVLFVNTESARERFASAVGPVPGLAVEVMRNAADYDLAEEIAGQAAGDDVDLGPGVHFGFFGALFPRRRMRPVLDAIATIPRDRRRSLHLHIYCDGFDSKALLEEDLAAMPDDVRAQVHRHDLLGYATAMRTMQAMDVLVLVNGPKATDAVFVPGKLYDYLMARRPILFVGHPGEASALVARATGDPWCFAPTAQPALAAKIESELAADTKDLPRLEDLNPKATFAPLLNRLTN
jgi:glycosyltransferase involved in cell wall biosynthesis